MVLEVDSFDLVAAEPSAWKSGGGGGEPPLEPGMYAAVHYMLAQIHARHMQVTLPQPWVPLSETQPSRCE